MWDEVVHPDDRPKLSRFFESIRSGQSDEIRLRATTEDGAQVSLHVVGGPGADRESPRIIGIVSAGKDAAAPEKVEETLGRAHDPLRRLLSASPVVLYTCEPTGNYAAAFVTENIKTQLGYEVREVLADPRFWIDRIHPEDKPQVLAEVPRLSEKGAHDRAYRFRHKDGTYRWIYDRRSLVRDDEGRPVEIIGSWMDITERKQVEVALRATEEQLRQSQKMDAIGRLAGGIAHDFSNLMTAVIGYSELLLERVDKGGPLRKDIEEIHKAGQRAVALTKQLLAFGRKQILPPTVFNLNVVIAEMEEMLRHLIGEDIELVMDLAPDLQPIEANPDQIQQVIINLAINARDAMGESRKLTIETADLHLTDDYVGQHVDATPGPHALLAVSDTGCGMDEETQARIFEPFFTTKPRGEGTGLGLSIVYGIVKQNRGNIWVYSEPGRGTTFKIYFPTTARDPDPAEAQAPSETSPNPSETVLLVEDEEIVKLVAKRILDAHGYKVLEAADGHQALLLGHDHTGPIHLLLTDVVMPGMNGGELYERLRHRRPEIKVLYMSGYTQAAARHNQALNAAEPLIQKPFTSTTLAHRVRQALDEPHAEQG